MGTKVSQAILGGSSWFLHWVIQPVVTNCLCRKNTGPSFPGAQSQRNETFESNVAGAAHQLSEEAAQGLC